jgi:hypothetical protein
MKYLGSIVTNDVRCMREIKSRTAIAKAVFNKKKSFYQKIGFKFEKETGKMLYLEHGFVQCCNLDASGSRSEIPGKF